MDFGLADTAPSSARLKLVYLRIAAAIMACVATLTLAPRTCRAASYYFSGAGNDASGTGTLASPWQSINKLNTLNLDPGDNVYFRAGDTFTGNIVLDAADTANNGLGSYGGSPITIAPYGTGNRPIVSSPTGYGLRATNAGGLEIRGLEFAGTNSITSITDMANASHGISFENTLSNFRQNHVYVDNVVVHGFGNDGINFHAQNPTINSGGFQDVRVTNSEVYLNGRNGISSTAVSATGTVVGSSTYDFQARAHANFTVTNSIARNITGKSGFTGASGSGIVLGQIDGALMERNVAHHNGGIAGGAGVGIWTLEGTNVAIRYNESYNNSSFNGYDGSGFDLDGGVKNSVMEYNYSHGNYGAGLGLYEFGYASPMDRNTIRYNISEGDGSGISVWGYGPHGAVPDVVRNSIIYNNTIIHPNGPAAHFFGSVEGVGLYNNIFVTDGANPAIKLEDFDGNASGFIVDVQLLRNLYWSGNDPLVILWKGATYNSVTAWANATGQEKILGNLVGLQIDPKLMGPFNGGVTLNDPALLPTLSAYQLLASSPIINAGRSLASLTRPVSLGLTNPGSRDFYGGPIPIGGIFDIGAHERSIPGDFNGNGVVDAADYVVWREWLGSVTKLMADISANGSVDAADYLVWRSVFGKTYNGSAIGGALDVIPEPSAVVMLLCAILVLLRTRRLTIAS